jgi:hypothetical protein
MRRRDLAAVAASALAAGVAGCAHCDDCDNFPVPANMGASMMPGTYTGPSPTVGGSQTRNQSPRLIDDQAPAATNAPTGTNADSSVPTPPPSQPPANP